jgi:hypothetical protein
LLLSPSSSSHPQHLTLHHHLLLLLLSLSIQHIMASKFWLISAPPMPTPEQAYAAVEEKTGRVNLSRNTRFAVPALKVGTMDALMSLSDDLVKADNFVEATARRIGVNLISILNDGQANREEQRPANQVLQINGGLLLRRSIANLLLSL